MVITEFFQEVVCLAIFSRNLFLKNEAFEFLIKYNELTITTTKTLICPGWETPIVPVSQPGTPVRDKRGALFVPGLATGTKGAASAHMTGAPFCPGWCYQPG